MNTLQQIFVVLLVAQLTLFCGHQGVVGKEESVHELASSSTDSQQQAVRQKRAPGWGKRSGELDSFDSNSDDELSEAVAEELDPEKRAPGWGKRDLEMEKRAPGWGKRAPGWGKRAPGWGKRAPGWGKRAPGWGKRAPGWGKRAPGWGKRSTGDFDVDTEEKRAPGWGKRAPGWGKRAPGWGKRAPGWGKRAPGWGKRASSLEVNECRALVEQVDFYVRSAVQAEARLEEMCGSEPESPISTDRK